MEISFTLPDLFFYAQGIIAFSISACSKKGSGTVHRPNSFRHPTKVWGEKNQLKDSMISVNTSKASSNDAVDKQGI